MSRRATLAQLSSFTLAASALLAPLAHAGGTGGTGLGPAGGAPPLGAPSPTSTPAATTVQATGDGITFATQATTLLRRHLAFSGQVVGGAGQIVEIERRGPQTSNQWLPTTHGQVARDGSFTAVWPANRTGRFSVRAVVESPAAVASARGTASRATPASPSLTITVYRPAIATIFGPGFFGQRTACGQILRHSTLGVANRTLPCGTPVSLLWHGQTIVVPVIDRGPYANGADWDLTSATAAALGITGTERVGAVPLSR